MHSQATILREDLSVGVKHDWVPKPDSPNAMHDETIGYNAEMLIFGLQFHTANKDNGHDFAEFYFLYNHVSGKMGGQLVYRNSPAFLPWIFGRIALAYLPTIKNPSFYMALVELGTTFEL